MDHHFQGFIPGPNETEQEFLTRVNYCLSLRHHLPQAAVIRLEDQQTCLQEASSITLPLYGLHPQWVPILFANHKLAPWHGGCAWIFQMDESLPLGAFLQLRKPFLTTQRYLGLYDRNELVAHELCHVARMAFEEPIYEEHLAYRSSGPKWRRWLGPIIRNSVESMLFFLALLFVFAGYLFALLVDPTSWAYVPYFYLLPASLALCALARLTLEHRALDATSRKLKDLVGNKADQMLLWLTDKEINSFSRLSKEQIRAYLLADPTYRVQSLVRTYLI